MNRYIYTSVLLGLALSGCSGVDSKRASGDFGYAKLEEAKPITVPSSLKAPKQGQEYLITDDVNLNGPVGEQVDIRAPSLALPIATSSRVDPKSQEVIIWFDQVFDDKNLAQFIHGAVAAQLSDDGVGTASVNDETLVTESNWYIKEHEISGWFYDDIEPLDQSRFRFKVSPKPHGRSASLTVELAEYEHLVNPGQPIDLIDKHRSEMHMLNEVVAQVDYEYRQLQREKRLEKANQKIVTIGENTVGEASYIIDMELDAVWQNLPEFFQDYGFTITDLNETKKIYFVDFTKPENSFWTSLWGEDMPIIDVADAKYQFVLQEQGEQTALTIYDADGAPIKVDVLTRILPVMEPGLSFRNVF